MKSALILLLSVLLIIPCVAQEIEYDVELQAPGECEIGQLVVMNVSAPEAAGVTWQISPASEDFKVFEKGRVAVFSARSVGKYLVIVACAVENRPSLLIHELNVSERVNSLSADIGRSVKAVAGDFEAKRVILGKLVNLFRTLANSPIPVDEMNESVAKSVKDLLGDDQSRWEHLLDVIGFYLDELANEDKLETKEDYQKVWSEIADALEKAC